MFENIGEEIKKLAKVIFWIRSIYLFVFNLLLKIEDIYDVKEFVYMVYDVATDVISIWLVCLFICGIGKFIENGDRFVKNSDVFVSLYYKKHNTPHISHINTPSSYEQYTEHMWRCPKCANMISETVCPYCGNASSYNGDNFEKHDVE